MDPFYNIVLLFMMVIFPIIITIRFWRNTDVGLFRKLCGAFALFIFFPATYGYALFVEKHPVFRIMGVIGLVGTAVALYYRHLGRI